MEHAATGIRDLLLDAVEDLTGVITTRPSELAAYFNRAVVFDKLGQVNDAMTDIDMVSLTLSNPLASVTCFMF
jgi:hypothetical protein